MWPTEPEGRMWLSSVLRLRRTFAQTLAEVKRQLNGSIPDKVVEQEPGAERARKAVLLI